jgi:hypothetical protein
MDRSVGLLVVVAGVFIIVVGVLIYSGALSWFGRLPGDIRYERGSVRVYIPIVSMLLIFSRIDCALQSAAQIFLDVLLDPLSCGNE